MSRVWRILCAGVWLGLLGGGAEAAEPAPRVPVAPTLYEGAPLRLVHLDLRDAAGVELVDDPLRAPVPDGRHGLGGRGDLGDPQVFHRSGVSSQRGCSPRNESVRERSSPQARNTRAPRGTSAIVFSSRSANAGSRAVTTRGSHPVVGR